MNLLIAWDLETVPLDLETLSDRQKRRLDIRLKNAEWESEDEVSKAMALHPALGRICCISVVSELNGSRRDPKSYTAATPELEADMLGNFWQDLKMLPDRYTVRWITYNGKGFDVEFLKTRSLIHGIKPTRMDILDDYPFSFHPHADLMKFWRNAAMGLADACDLLGIQDPKQGTYHGVTELMEAGGMDAVVAYCERDVQATLDLFHNMQHWLR